MIFSYRHDGAICPQIVRMILTSGLRGGVQAVGDSVEVVVEEARVDVAGHRRARGAEHPLDGLDVGARGDGEPGGGVPELVRGQLAEPGRIERRVEDTA